MGKILDGPAILLVLLFPIAVVAAIVWLIVKIATGGRAAPPVSPPPAPPGWYRQADGSQRWWDGYRWSDHTTP